MNSALQRGKYVTNWGFTLPSNECNPVSFIYCHPWIFLQHFTGILLSTLWSTTASEAYLCISFLSGMNMAPPKGAVVGTAS